MGWASGSKLAENVWRCVKPFVPIERRVEIANKIIEEFRMHDWDTVTAEKSEEAETLYYDAERHLQ